MKSICKQTPNSFKKQNVGKIFLACLVVCFLVLLSLFPLAAKAQSKGLILKNANSMIRNDEQKRIDLSGNVELIFHQQYLSADKVTVYLDRKQLEATGKVILASPNIYAEAEKLFFNYKTNQGVMYKAFVQSDKTHFTGEVIYKTDENTYKIKNSEYTTCTNCSASWSFSGNEIEAVFGESATIKQSFMKIKGVPVLWFPYFIVPLKNERQSGLLAPIIENSKNGGFTFGLNYYHVNSQNSDSQHSFTNYEKRGLKYNYHYRYALSPTDRGELRFAYLDDAFFGKDYVNYNSNHSGSSIDRWFFNYNHRFDLPQSYTQRTQLFLISDNQYPFDFPLDVSLEGYAALENRISVTKSTAESTRFVEVIASKNLLSSDPLEDNEDAVHRFPEFRLQTNIQKIADTKAYYQMDVSFTNFARPDKAYQDVSSGTAVSDSYDAGTDYIRAGQRIMIQPKIYYPIKTNKYLDILPSIELQSNLYQFGVPSTSLEYIASQNPNAIDEGNTAGQHKIELKLDAQSRFHRIYEIDDKSAFKHEIIPRITYQQTPFLRRDNHSFFEDDPEDYLSSSLGVSDGDKIQFDYDDQMFDQRSIEFGLKNYITRRNITKDEKRIYQNTFFWNLYQSYDFKEKTEPLSDVTSIMNFNFNHWGILTELHYFPYKNITNSNLSLRYNAFTNSFIELGYNSRYEVRRNQNLDPNTKTESIRTSLYYLSDNFSFGGAADYSLITNRFQNHRVGAMFQPAGDCWRLGLSYNSPVLGEQVTKAIFEWFFDGKKWSGDNLKSHLDLD